MVDCRLSGAGVAPGVVDDAQDLYLQLDRPGDVLDREVTVDDV